MKRPPSFWCFIVTGICILVCIPLILISEKFGYPDDPYHLIQMILIPVCLASGIRYSSKHKTEKGGFIKYLVRIGVCLCGLFILFVGIIVFGPTVEDFTQRERFDAELWRSEENVELDTEWPHRLRMVDDLMSSGKLEGLTKSQVVDLLGPPFGKGFPAGAVNCDIHYYLGPERGFMKLDSEWLFITFGDDESIKEYWLYRD